MKINKKDLITTGLAVTLALGVLIGGGTYSYLQGQTNDVTNTFKTNKVDVTLTETGNGQYNIIPGTEQDKDPKVTVDNSVDAYVYVEVTDETQGLVTYAIANGWTKLDGYNNVYYREVEADADSKKFSVLKDDEVTYSVDLTNESMEGKTNVQLTFRAYAIQKESFKDAKSGYLAVTTGVVANNYFTATKDDLTNVLGEVNDGDAIVLSGEVDLQSTLTIKKAVTIVGDGNTVIKSQPITTNADVTFKNIEFEKPTNKDKNATLVYGQAGTENIVFEGCTFSNPQWEAIQITSNDIKSIVINNCVFNADNVDGAASSYYGNTENQAIRYIHVQCSYSNQPKNVKIQITNNTFNDIAKVKDSIVGIYYLSGQITVGGNTFYDWGENDVDNNYITGKLSVNWPAKETLKVISKWTSAENTTEF